MNKLLALTVLLLCVVATAKGETAPVNEPNFISNPADDAIGSKTALYFKGLFELMAKAAAKDPDVDSFRAAMKPVADGTTGFYGGTLLDSNWTIVQVYDKAHFLARGFSLKKVKELTGFIKKMAESPAPQLSEPGHGSLIQPRLIAMRYPVIKDGKMIKMVSMMIKTEAFTKAVGLDDCKAYRITCLGQVAEEKGKLKSPTTVKLELPSTEWVIEYSK
jgi:hypothetical protein